MRPEACKSLSAWLSVFSNSTLVLGKLIIGLWIGSVSVISEGIHSGVDLLASVIALIAVKTASKPADQRHPYGHGKAENISGTIEAFLIFIAAAWIIAEATGKLLHPEPIEQIGWGIAIMLVSTLLNIGISGYLFKVARDTDSLALEADAWHLRTDVYTSAGVFAGLGLIWAGERILQRFYPGLHLHWIDPVAALVMACLIIRAAWVLTRKSAGGLMDIQIPPEEEEWIRHEAKQMSPIIRSLHSLKTRKAGADRFVEFHLMVDGGMSVEESHHIAHELAGRIESHFSQSSVTVHVEPCAGDCDENCAQRCLMAEEERQKARILAEGR